MRLRSALRHRAGGTTAAKYSRMALKQRPAEDRDARPVQGCGGGQEQIAKIGAAEGEIGAVFRRTQDAQKKSIGIKDMEAVRTKIALSRRTTISLGLQTRISYGVTNATGTNLAAGQAAGAERCQAIGRAG